MASCGDTKAEALAMLADALALHESEGEAIDDEEAFLRDIGVDPEEVEDARDAYAGLPEFKQ